MHYQWYSHLYRIIGSTIIIFIIASDMTKKTISHWPFCFDIWISSLSIIRFFARHLVTVLAEELTLIAEERYELLQSSMYHHGSVSLLEQLQICCVQFKFIMSASLTTGFSLQGAWYSTDWFLLYRSDGVWVSPS